MWRGLSLDADPSSGESVGEAKQGPIPLMRQGYEACGEVFTVPLLHKKVTFLLGPHVSEHFFKASDDELSQKEVMAPCCIKRGDTTTSTIRCQYKRMALC